MPETRPGFVTEEHLEYLDELRESGEINMFDAVPYVQVAFVLTRKEARAVLAYWMQTFDKRHSQE